MVQGLEVPSVTPCFADSSHVYTQTTGEHKCASLRLGGKRVAPEVQSHGRESVVLPRRVSAIKIIILRVSPGPFRLQNSFRAKYPEKFFYTLLGTWLQCSPSMSCGCAKLCQHTGKCPMMNTAHPWCRLRIPLPAMAVWPP